MKEIIKSISKKTGFSEDYVIANISCMLESMYLSARRYEVISIRDCFDIHLHPEIFKKKIYGQEVAMKEGSFTDIPYKRSFFIAGRGIKYKTDNKYYLGIIHRVVDEMRIVVKPIIELTRHLNSKKKVYYRWLKIDKGLCLVNISICSKTSSYRFIKSNIHNLVPLVSIKTMNTILSNSIGSR